jgi:co-chaperonin GroES (HSP10)
MSPSVSQSDLDYFFPEVDPGLIPSGSRVLIQLRSPIQKTKGGIHLPDETKDVQKDIMQIAKVIALGPLAFRNRDTREEWVEGAWCKKGDFIRGPKYAGDSWEVKVPGRDMPAVFKVINDLDIIGVVTCNPLEIVAYVG